MKTPQESTNQVQPDAVELVTQELFEAGELVHLTNAQFGSDVQGPHTTSSYDLLHGITERYGKENVLTGNAFDSETGTASGIPRHAGIYVTKVAYEAANKSLES